MAPRKTTNAPSIQTVLQVIQIVVLLGGLATMFVQLGRRDAQVDIQRVQLDEVRDVLREIAKAQTSFLVVDATHTVEIGTIRQQMVDLRAQIDRMEQARGGGK